MLIAVKMLQHLLPGRLTRFLLLLNFPNIHLRILPSNQNSIAELLSTSFALPSRFELSQNLFQLFYHCPKTPRFTYWLKWMQWLTQRRLNWISLSICSVQTLYYYFIISWRDDKSLCGLFLAFPFKSDNKYRVTRKSLDTFLKQIFSTKKRYFLTPFFAIG